MANTPDKDYSTKGWIAIVVLIAVLLGVSLLPPQSIGGINFRRANIISDLVSFDDAQPATESSLFNPEEFSVDMEMVADKIEAAEASPESPSTTYEWIVGSVLAPRPKVTPRAAQLTETVVPIIDFGTSSHQNLQTFYDTLLLAKRPVRIAVMGDSFIEGDIMTADLREKMQQVYGGAGAGFAPMASPLTTFRHTIKTHAQGWTSFNIMQRRNAPAAIRDNFFISGWACQPSDGASTRWENTSTREKLDSCSTGRILFISKANSRVEVTINDTMKRQFDIKGNTAVSQIVVTAPFIRSLAFKVLSGAESMVGYGTIFESNGVVVDNYSVRSNNGMAMFWTNPSINAQINTILNYDLVILQYGLNIMQPEVRNYTEYGRQIDKMIDYVRQCFPTASILVMGVSDRAGRSDGGFAPMEAVPHMITCQQEAAQRTNTAFWNTCDAMRTHGGILQFVAKGWARKDHTHINYAGGRRVAWSLFDAINTDLQRTYANLRTILEIQQSRQAIVDSMRQEFTSWNRLSRSGMPKPSDITQKDSATK